MISVIIIWTYILLTTFAAGCICAFAGERITGITIRSFTGILIAGTVLVTVYAQIWSLFGGVGLVANICMCACITAAVFLMRGDLGRIIVTLFKPVNIRILIAAVFVFIIMAYGASHGIMHYDTGLYHAQAVHWIESFGSVPGLANLHTRLGYNSSAFALNALYSFAFTGQSYHVTGAYAALILAWVCVITPVVKHIPVISVPGFARIMGIYYLLMIYDEMVSPASDYYMVCLAFVLVILWADTDCISRSGSETAMDFAGAISADEELTDTYSLLAVLACFILTVKLSGALFILFAILPGIRLIRQKRYKAFTGCIITGAVIILPYLIRNIKLSGWLLYPSTALGIFNVDWRVPRDIAQYDYREIQVYGRGFTDVTLYDEPVTSWFKGWFVSQSLTDRVLIAAAIVGVLYFVVKCLYGLVRFRRITDTGIFTEAVVSAGFIFWLLTSPLMRYGCLYVYLCDALIWGGLLVKLSSDRILVKRIIAAGLICLLGYKSVMFASEAVRAYRGDTWIRQQDYESFETFEYALTGEDGTEYTLYAPAEGDRTGYEPFPSSPWTMDDQIKLRGSSFEDGFAAGGTR